MRKTIYTPLANEVRLNLPTNEASFHLNRAQQTLRLWAMREDGPVTPIRINGRLAWPVSQLRRVLGSVWKPPLSRWRCVSGAPRLPNGLNCGGCEMKTFTTIGTTRSLGELFSGSKTAGRSARWTQSHLRRHYNRTWTGWRHWPRRMRNWPWRVANKRKRMGGDNIWYTDLKN